MVDNVFNTLAIRNVQAFHAGIYACFAQPGECPRFFSTNATLTIVGKKMPAPVTMLI